MLSRYLFTSDVAQYDFYKPMFRFRYMGFFIKKHNEQLNVVDDGVRKRGGSWSVEPALAVIENHPFFSNIDF